MFFAVPACETEKLRLPDGEGRAAAEVVPEGATGVVDLPEEAGNTAATVVVPGGAVSVCRPGPDVIVCDAGLCALMKRV